PERAEVAPRPRRQGVTQLELEPGVRRSDGLPVSKLFSGPLCGPSSEGSVRIADPPCRCRGRRVRGTHQFIDINHRGVFHTPYAEGTMSDQADGLRQLVRARSGTTALDEPESPLRSSHAPCKARSLLLTSGKGRVGTSNIALNLAIALGELGQRVVLVDADLG